MNNNIDIKDYPFIFLLAGFIALFFVGYLALPLASVGLYYSIKTKLKLYAFGNVLVLLVFIFLLISMILGG